VFPCFPSTYNPVPIGESSRLRRESPPLVLVPVHPRGPAAKCCKCTDSPFFLFRHASRPRRETSVLPSIAPRGSAAKLLPWCFTVTPRGPAAKTHSHRLPIIASQTVMHPSRTKPPSAFRSVPPSAIRSVAPCGLAAKSPSSMSLLSLSALRPFDSSQILFGDACISTQPVLHK
jgi:hypothetical protein